MRIICIYPIDETTGFLSPIYKSLSVLEVFTGYQIGVENEEIDNVVKDIAESEDGTIVVFLGHGASHCLYKSDRTPLFANKDFSIFQNKRLFFFSCRSAEFIDTNRHIPLTEYFGFGNMVTDLDEVLAARNEDANAYPNIDGEVIASYKQILTDILSKKLARTLGAGKNFNDLYLQIKLLFNKEIAIILKEKKHPNYRVLANLLYDTKCEMSIC
jgi:hypothetical protein